MIRSKDLNELTLGDENDDNDNTMIALNKERYYYDFYRQENKHFNNYKKVVCVLTKHNASKIQKERKRTKIVSCVRRRKRRRIINTRQELFRFQQQCSTTRLFKIIKLALLFVAFVATTFLTPTQYRIINNTSLNMMYPVVVVVDAFQQQQRHSNVQLQQLWNQNRLTTTTSRAATFITSKDNIITYFSDPPTTTYSRRRHNNNNNKPLLSHITMSFISSRNDFLINNKQKRGIGSLNLIHHSHLHLTSSSSDTDEQEIIQMNEKDNNPRDKKVKHENKNKFLNNNNNYYNLTSNLNNNNNNNNNMMKNNKNNNKSSSDGSNKETMNKDSFLDDMFSLDVPIPESISNVTTSNDEFTLLPDPNDILKKFEKEGDKTLQEFQLNIKNQFKSVGLNNFLDDKLREIDTIISKSLEEIIPDDVQSTLDNIYNNDNNNNNDNVDMLTKFQEILPKISTTAEESDDNNDNDNDPFPKRWPRPLEIRGIILQYLAFPLLKSIATDGPITDDWNEFWLRENIIDDNSDDNNDNNANWFLMNNNDNTNNNNNNGFSLPSNMNLPWEDNDDMHEKDDDNKDNNHINNKNDHESTTSSDNANNNKDNASNNSKDNVVDAAGNPIIVHHNKEKKTVVMTNADHVCNTIEKLGPTFVKIGQTLGSRTDLIPLALANTLSNKLENSMDPFDTNIAHTIIRNELKNNTTYFQNNTEVLNKFMSTLSKEPIGSASIAQVYKGYLSSGDAVAIKVKRPNIEHLIKRDAESFCAWALWVESLKLPTPNMIQDNNNEQNNQDHAQDNHNNIKGWIPSILESESNNQNNNENNKDINATSRTATDTTDNKTTITSNDGESSSSSNISNTTVTKDSEEEQESASGSSTSTSTSTRRTTTTAATSTTAITTSSTQDRGLIAARIADIVDEYMSRLTEEVSYKKELNNAQLFYEIYDSRSNKRRGRRWPTVIVPKYYPNLCTNNILVMEWLDCEKLYTTDSESISRDFSNENKETNNKNENANMINEMKEHVKVKGGDGNDNEEEREEKMAKHHSTNYVDEIITSKNNVDQEVIEKNEVISNEMNDFNNHIFFKSNNNKQQQRQKDEDLSIIKEALESTMSQLFDVGFVHADPHGGNILKVKVEGQQGRRKRRQRQRQQYKLGYVDFGMVAKVEPDLRDGLVSALVQLSFGQDAETLTDLVEHLQLLPEETLKNPNKRKQFTQLVDNLLINPSNTTTKEEKEIQSKEEGKYDIGQFDYILASVSALVSRFELKLPPYFLNNIRALITLEGLAKRIDPTYDIFSNVIYPYAAFKLLNNPRINRVVSDTMVKCLQSADGGLNSINLFDPNGFPDMVKNISNATGQSYVRTLFNIWTSKGYMLFMIRTWWHLFVLKRPNIRKLFKPLRYISSLQGMAKRVRNKLIIPSRIKNTKQGQKIRQKRIEK